MFGASFVFDAIMFVDVCLHPIKPFFHPYVNTKCLQAISCIANPVRSRSINQSGSLIKNSQKPQKWNENWFRIPSLVQFWLKCSLFAKEGRLSSMSMVFSEFRRPDQNSREKLSCSSFNSACFNSRDESIFLFLIVCYYKYKFLLISHFSFPHFVRVFEDSLKIPGFPRYKSFLDEFFILIGLLLYLSED